MQLKMSLQVMLSCFNGKKSEGWKYFSAMTLKQMYIARIQHRIFMKICKITQYYVNARMLICFNDSTKELYVLSFFELMAEYKHIHKYAYTYLFKLRSFF